MPRKQKGSAVIERTAAKLERLTIEYVPIGDIRPNDYNPNRQSEHEFALLVKSIEEDGFTQPIITAENGVIVDGEHRWRVARQLGYEQVPIVRVPMEEAQARIATLRHNRARGTEDIELATEVLRDLEQLGALDWASDALDMTDQELQRLLADVPAPDALSADEFGEAWRPSRDDGTGESGGRSYHDETSAGADRRRAMEQRLAEAKTEQDRKTIQRETDIFRIVLVYSGDEAKLVKRELGQAPAETLLAWCRERQPVAAEAG